MQLLVYISFLGCLILCTSAQVTEITAFPDYIAARACVQRCAFLAMQYGLCSGIGPGIECPGCPLQSSLTCLCGTLADVSSSINSVVYSCASSACGDLTEATSAANIFHEYCTAGSSALPQATSTVPLSTGMPLTIPLPFITLCPRLDSCLSRCSDRHSNRDSLWLGLRDRYSLL
jgi:hypothetical protein